jgi:hypothetical protein
LRETAVERVRKQPVVNGENLTEHAQMETNSGFKSTKILTKKVPLDQMSRQELKECAQVLAINCERYKEQLRQARKKYQDLQGAYQRLKNRSEALGKQLEDAALGENRYVPIKKEQEEKVDQDRVGHSNSRPSRKKAMENDDMQTPNQKLQMGSGDDDGARFSRKHGRDDSSELNTPVSITHLGGTIPSCLKVVAETEESQNTSQKDRRESSSVTFLEKKERGIKSPPWKSVKKMPRPARASAAVESPPCLVPEQLQEKKGAFNEDRAFKYMEIIRKKDDRKNLPAWFCPDCAKFYKVYAQYGDLDRANEMVKRLCGHSVHQETSRHRRKYDPPPSPPNYWDIQHLEPHT